MRGDAADDLGLRDAARFPFLAVPETSVGLDRVSTSRPRRRRESSPRNFHVAVAASPRLVSKEYPRREATRGPPRGCSPCRRTRGGPPRRRRRRRRTTRPAFRGRISPRRRRAYILSFEVFRRLRSSRNTPALRARPPRTIRAAASPRGPRERFEVATPSSQKRYCVLEASGPNLVETRGVRETRPPRATTREARKVQTTPPPQAAREAWDGFRRRARDHGDDLGLELPETGKNFRVERVARVEHGRGRVLQVRQRRAVFVVDAAPLLARREAGRARFLLAEAREDRVRREASLGQRVVRVVVACAVATVRAPRRRPPRNIQLATAPRLAADGVAAARAAFFSERRNRKADESRKDGRRRPRDAAAAPSPSRSFSMPSISSARPAAMTMESTPGSFETYEKIKPTHAL